MKRRSEFSAVHLNMIQTIEYQTLYEPASQLAATISSVRINHPLSHAPNHHLHVHIFQWALRRRESCEVTSPKRPKGKDKSGGLVTAVDPNLNAGFLSINSG